MSIYFSVLELLNSNNFFVYINYFRRAALTFFEVIFLRPMYIYYFSEKLSKLMLFN